MAQKTAWDDEKNIVNIRDHHIDFSTLEELFDGRFCLVKEDQRHDYGEQRYNMLVEYRGYIINVTLSPRDGQYRLISARPANRKERKAYVERKQQT